MFTVSLISVLLIACVGKSIAVNGHWDYSNGSDGPQNWAKNYKMTCAGVQQSPIDLGSEAQYNGDLKRIFIQKLGSSTADLEVTNDGHGVIITLPDNNWGMHVIEGEEPFVIAQFHFHWGPDNSKGSEHTINSRAYPLEGHLVTYRKHLYANFAEAAGKPNGLAVLGIFFEVSQNSTHRWKEMATLVKALATIKTPLTKTTIPAFDWADSFSSANLADYYRYIGSLTTPPCTENVIWSVLRMPLFLTSVEMAAFRALLYSASYGTGPIVRNYRPILPLNPVNAPFKRSLHTSFNSAHNVNTSFTCKILTLILAIGGAVLSQSHN